MKALTDYDPYQVEGDRKPGVCLDLLQKLGENLQHASACLTYDGKRVKQGLTIDLLGFEDGITLEEVIMPCKLK